MPYMPYMPYIPYILHLNFEGTMTAGPWGSRPGQLGFGWPIRVDGQVTMVDGRLLLRGP